MQLTIILTSYNRPLFVARAVQSILAQTSPHWRLIIQDDGSGQSVLSKLRPFADKDYRITLNEHTVTNRTEVTRYAVLINEILPTLTDGIVGYMCDNVEYRPEMVDSVLSYFEHTPDAQAGYIYHQRDMWTADGRHRLGRASDYRHWNFTPPVIQDIYTPIGMLDHSQVFHRVPVNARWEEGIHALKCGDGLFFQQLILETGAIRPIRPGMVLSLEHLVQ